MMRRTLLVVVLASVFWAAPVRATDRAIVRVDGGSAAINTICVSLGCTVTEAIGDPLNQVFLIASNTSDSGTLISQLSTFSAVVNCEPDLLAKAADASYTVPASLTDSAPVTYFGTTVPYGYISQPPVTLVRLNDAQTAFGVNGAGIVAVIDTGVDPNHPALKSVVLRGYDFTRNQDVGDETKDLKLSSTPRNGPSTWVSANVVANIDQSTAAVVDGKGSGSAFGHGTMVAGVIHLVAPAAMILPFKVFGPDGTGYLSDILRAIYRAVQCGANVINMSFTYTSPSNELKSAMTFASGHDVVAVGAAGNDGQQVVVYPAGMTNLVMGVASITTTDQLSWFSNYGPQLVWVAAPGEGIVTTYPYGMYAAGWGTSFSTPFVAGTAALLFQLSTTCNQQNAQQAIANAVPINSNVGYGQLDIYQAVQAWRHMLGMP